MGHDTDNADGRFDTLNSIEFTDATAFMQNERYDRHAIQLRNFPSDAPNIFALSFNDVPQPGFILSSLQLATKFLTLPRVENFFHALLGDLRMGNDDYTPNYKVLQHPQKRSVQYCEIRREEWDPDRTLPPGGAASAIDYLVRMLDYRMHVYEFDAGNQVAITIQAEDPTDFRHFARLNELFVCNGYRSTTKLPMYLYDNLQRAMDTQDVLLLMHSGFELAITIVHELAHAARNCLSGKHDMEPFFGHNPIAELGFELESLIFDGHSWMMYSDGPGPYTFEGKKSGLQGVLVLSEYPNQGVVNDYKDFGEDGEGVSKRDDDDGGTALKPLDVAWRVPLKFLEKFFDPAWWNGNFRAVGATHPERTVGYCFRTDEKGARIPVIRSTAERKYVPDGYYRHPRTGDILLPNQNNLLSNVVRTRLLQNATSTTPRRWVEPYEPGGEYDGLTTLERRKREIVYRLGESLSVVQPGGRYEHADRNGGPVNDDFPGHSELLLGLLVEGIIRLKSKNRKQLTRREALILLRGKTKYQRADLVDKIAKENILVRQLGFGDDDDDDDDVDDYGVPLAILGRHPDMVHALDLNHGDILEGSFWGNPMEQSNSVYQIGMAFRNYTPADEEWQLTDGFRPYSSLRYVVPSVLPLATSPQGDVSMEDDRGDDEDDDDEDDPMGGQMQTTSSQPRPVPQMPHVELPPRPRDVFDMRTGRFLPFATTAGTPSMAPQTLSPRRAPSAPYPTVPQSGVTFAKRAPERWNPRQAPSFPTSSQNTAAQQPRQTQPTTMQDLENLPSAPRIPMTTEEETRMLRDAWEEDSRRNAREKAERDRMAPPPPRPAPTVATTRPAGLHSGFPLTGEQETRILTGEWIANGIRVQREEREEAERRRRGGGGGGGGDDMDLS